MVEQRTENPCVPGSIPGDGNKWIVYLISMKGLGFPDPFSFPVLCFCFSANGLVPIGAPIERERTSVSKYSQIWLLALQFNGNYH